MSAARVTAPAAQSRQYRGFPPARVPAAVEWSVSTTAEVAVPTEVGAAAVLVEPAAAATGTARAGQDPVGAAHSIRDTVADLIDGTLNWLNGLPSNPVTDFLSGALLLVRRDIEASVANPDHVPPGLMSTVSSDQTFVVSTLADSGSGSLRQAILDANAAAGADTINFAVAGTIAVGSAALPTVTGNTAIDGTSAPGYDGAPVVQIDFGNTEGLMLAAGADGSYISGLSLVDAAGAGVTVAASNTTLAGNYIGLWGNGTTVEANRGDGVLVLAGANNNVIGSGSTESFALSNVISGNRGNGITIQGNGNIVQANYVGTNSNGGIALGNRGNGILITAGAFGNVIGGTATGGNNPIPPDRMLVRPPQGNLISGNCDNGVLINNGATGNQLSGNFIGTDSTGNVALGNRQDGVAIVGANGNQLIGTTSSLKPFVFYNVLSGNGGNGLRITDSNETTVWANFFGTGADNRTAVANGGNGMLVNGTSLGVKAGGPIPLGNVMSGNRRYGIEIADTAGGVLMFNEFVGQSAFGRIIPNNAGGIRITSSNPNYNPGNTITPETFEPTNASNSNEIRTCLIGGNQGNGIEFLGDAYGAQVVATAVGTDATIALKFPNTGSGIVIGGNASNISIGGFTPSIQYLLSDGFGIHVGANDGWGIIIEGNAQDVSVINTRVGLGAGIRNQFPLPNGKGGISVGPGTSNITIGGPIGSPDPLSPFNVEIALNDGPGLSIRGARDVTVQGAGIEDNHGDGIYASGNLSGTTVQTSTISGNDGSGVWLRWARGITVGGTQGTDFNTIVDNAGWGILATGWSRGSALTGNAVSGNTRGQINTTFSTLPSPTVTVQQIFQQSGSQSPEGTLHTGVRGAGGDNVALTLAVVPQGETDAQAALYVGPLGSLQTATPTILQPQFEGVTSSTFYGPNTHWFNPRLIPEGQVQAVGNFKGDDKTGQPYRFEQGMIYLGPPDDATAGVWTRVNVPSSGSDTVGGVSACQGRSADCSVASTIPHSTMGDLVVGNYDLAPDGQTQDPDTVNAFIYNTATRQFTLLGSNGDPFGELDNHTTVYGIWQNGGQDSSLYTLTGGTGKAGVDAGEKGFLVTYDSRTGEFGTPSYYTAQDAGVNTHFEGITPTLGGFALAGESLSSQGLTKFAAFVPTVVPLLPFGQNVDSIRYGSAVWAPVDVDNSNVCPSGCVVTTANTIYENRLFGVFDNGQGSGLQTYEATLRGRFGLLPLWYL